LIRINVIDIKWYSRYVRSMEPAMALCAGVATFTLTFGVIASLPATVRRLAAVHVRLPARPVAALLMVASLVPLLARSSPAAAAVPPPIVRFTDGGHGGEGDAGPAAAKRISPAAAPDHAAAPARVAGLEPGDHTYVVRSGDSLWCIAERILAVRTDGTVTGSDVARFWPAVYEANRALIGEDPNLIFPGQTLQIPEA
jgi:nucleoid-associated protein YgaU